MGELPVSVVITVLNEAAGTSVLLTVLTQQTKPPDEIIVVDGGSTDGTIEIVEQFIQAGHRVRLLCEPGCNISMGRNLGIKSAQCDIIACTDAGCTPEYTWLDTLTEPFRNPKVGVVGGVCRADTHSHWEQVIGLMTVPGALTAIEPAHYNPSARNMAFRKTAWRHAGGFPEWLYTAEDTLFDCQLKKLGVGFVFAPEALVRWRPRQSLPALWRQISGYARGEGQIGRAGDSARFWVRRYVVAVCLLLTCLVSAYMLSSMMLIAVGLGAAAILSIAPLTGKAYRVGIKTGRLIDFPLAVVVGHVMAAADAVGFTRGSSQRLRNPEGFIKPLKDYWGDPVVVNVPRWQLVKSPTPQTLIVCWYWAPNCRASANVLSNLFVPADRDLFSVITREVLPPSFGDNIASPSCPTHRVQWPTWCSQESGLAFIMASLCTVLRLVRRAMLLHRDRPFDRTMAVYPHRFSLLAGLFISIATNTKLVLYMHDLLAESLAGQGMIRRAIWRMMDRIALDRAWLIVVPTREFADHYRRRGLTNTLVIPHCLPADVTIAQADTLQAAGQHNLEVAKRTIAEPATLTRTDYTSTLPTLNALRETLPNNIVQKYADQCCSTQPSRASTNFSSVQSSACRSGRKRPLRLIYTGKVYEAHDDAIRALVEATRDLVDVELTLLSNAHTATQTPRSTWMTRKQALRAIDQADVAVVALGMQTPYPTEIAGCFPSKIIDYISMGRPILAVVPTDCFVDRFVRENDCGVSVNSFSSIDIQAAIAELADPIARARMVKAILAVRDKLSARNWLAVLNSRLIAGPAPQAVMQTVTTLASDTLLNRSTPALFKLETGVNP